MKTTDYRRDFPLLMQETAAYLDNAATAQRPRCVLDAEKTFYETQNANPLRGLYPLSIAATEAVEEARFAISCTPRAVRRLSSRATRPRR